MFFEHICIALAAHTSLIGFDPWYAGLNSGDNGASLMLNGIAVNDSSP